LAKIDDKYVGNPYLADDQEVVGGGKE